MMDSWFLQTLRLALSLGFGLAAGTMACTPSVNLGSETTRGGGNTVNHDADGGCTGGRLIQSCVHGQVKMLCCLAGELCIAPSICELGGGACVETSGSIDASNYNQSCAADADCAFAYSGPFCGCYCPNAAINKSMVGAYNAAIQSAPTSDPPCLCPPFPPPTCDAGVCVMSP
jgi:hypothetical protein